MKNCLIIFAKEPEAGRVKTRLQGCLSRQECVELYKAFLQDIVSLGRKLKGLNTVLAYDATSAGPVYLRTIAPDFIFYKQRGRDLGAKMHNAFKFTRGINCDKTVLIGSDFPNLPARYIKEAFKRLDTSDIVLGPSIDGGYYLVGLKQPCPGLFKDVQWSSASVLERTVRNALALRKKISFL
ncbi:MAG: TIGR04282 family arsenosugar biosynthesis glycosyltransferase, partial [bacterium]|nr:TIGR04282 family arsenosugar biosynthesis glycosyltransferase [bacterium]